MGPSSCLVSLNSPAAPRARLVCLHHAGGADHAYREWPARFRVDLQIEAGILPGRGRRFGEALPESVREVVIELTDAMISGWTNRIPVVLFGHSLGALLALETASLLDERGYRLARLVLSGVPPPSHRDTRTRHLMSDGELLQELREMGGTPPEVLEHPDLMKLLLPVIRADLKLAEIYDPSSLKRLRCPMTVLAGEEDEFDAASIEGWGGHTDGDFATHVFPGGHFYLHEHHEQFIPWLENHLSDVGAISGARPA